MLKNIYFSFRYGEVAREAQAVDPEAVAWLRNPANPTRGPEIHDQAIHFANQNRLQRAIPTRPKMVYYFSSNTVTPSAFIYVGKDKVESEYLRIES